MCKSVQVSVFVCVSVSVRVRAFVGEGGVGGILSSHATEDVH